MTIEALKLEIIHQVLNLSDSSKLRKINAALKKIQANEEELLKHVTKPTRKQLNIEELKKEQHFKPIDKKKFFKKIEKLDITESLEDLLAMI